MEPQKLGFASSLLAVIGILELKKRIEALESIVNQMRGEK